MYHLEKYTTSTTILCKLMLLHSPMYMCSRLLQIKNLPDRVLDRRAHSMNVVAMSATCLWLLVIGGLKSGSVTEYASSVFALIEMS